MKKYMITGMAALAMGCTFTACTHDTGFDENAIRSQVIDTYEKAFVNAFGQPAAEQDWGFGVRSYKNMTGTRTRSNPGETYPATHEYVNGGANANANHWADPSDYFGGWLVPDPLTENQKLRVQMYFQANPYLDYKDPHFRHFFVQQVYKGATDPGENSTEVVTAANGSTYTSVNMNQLTVGQSEMHINNFNAGTCSTNGTVLKNGFTVNNAQYQSDQIMLMVNIDDTSCFGYHDTGSSNESDDKPNHNDRMALVSAATIDAWADAHNSPGDPVVDKWNRSFMGFDLALKEGDKIFTDEIQTYTSGLNMGYDGVYFGDDNIVRWVEVDPTHAADATHPYGNYDKTTPAGFENVMKDAEGNPLKILSAKTNFYSGDLKKIDDSFLRKDNNGVLLNMKKVNEELISQGYYPVSGSAFKDWVKPMPSYDNYYSDWIVTLTEAQRIPQETVVVNSSADIRVIAEDLSITDVDDEGRAAKSDLDFNDVVFDVEWISGGAKITLQAAGGTLPLVVGVVPNPNNEASWTDYEVHGRFGVAVNTIVNTNHRLSISKPTVTFTLNGDFGEDASKIPVYVRKGGQWYELTAAKGQPASKIGVAPSFQWVPERMGISEKYPNFSSWVQNGSPLVWW